MTLFLYHYAANILIMKYNAFFIILFGSLLFNSSVFGQEAKSLNVNRFADISKTEADFTTSNVAARMVEGLGFRYYWATEGLTDNDLSYKPSESGRTQMETIEHIHGLSVFMMNAFKLIPSGSEDAVTFKDLRKNTLLNLEMLEKRLKSMTTEEFDSFQVGEITFWHMINGPIADAIWHTGQVVMLRRASDNPLPKGVNVLMGVKN